MFGNWPAPEFTLNPADVLLACCQLTLLPYNGAVAMDCLPSYFNFYARAIKTLLDRGLVNRSMRVLVVCGGENDRRVFQQFGFTDVTISNLDSRMTEGSFAPYHWSFQDAESLAFPDGSFDLAVVCAGLHHCHSPHRALLEVYRVARCCALAVEARDGLLSRLAVRLGVAEEYELAAVVGNDYQFGGVKNTSIPNYVYRWTEREVLKTIASYAPHARPRVMWFHEFNPPVEILRARKSLRGLLILYAAYPALWLITRVFKSQCNFFGFAVLKPEFPRDQFPWVRLEDDRPAINVEWARARFKTPNHRILSPGAR